ncbi:uncharacterized protein [Onthophagus taurus]|uniref:uncharacterized protein isoform X2 n=1 Tax=Onthophagus taurus TaxID=166361 RepID=UPI0039BDF7A8
MDKGNYQIRPGASKKLLKEDAFPSVFKESPNHLQKPTPSKRRLLSRVIEKEEQAEDIETMPSTSTIPDLSEISGQNSMQCDVGIQCIIQSPTNIKLRQKIKILQQQLKRRDLRINSLKNLLQEIKKRISASRDVVTMLEEQFSGFPLQILLHERKSNKVKSSGVRYNDSIKDFAKTLFYCSPKAYAFVGKLFTLPHPATIRNWMNSSKCQI